MLGRFWERKCAVQHAWCVVPLTISRSPVSQTVSNVDQYILGLLAIPRSPKPNSSHPKAPSCRLITEHPPVVLIQRISVSFHHRASSYRLITEHPPVVPPQRIFLSFHHRASSCHIISSQTTFHPHHGTQKTTQKIHSHPGLSLHQAPDLHPTKRPLPHGLSQTTPPPTRTVSDQRSRLPPLARNRTLPCTDGSRTTGSTGAKRPDLNRRAASGRTVERCSAGKQRPNNAIADQEGR